MKVLGIIGEYNPMHSGHIYHIEKSKKICNADFTVLLMSGNFTQIGNIATLDKYTRAKIACNNGIDIVIELPSIYAVSSAQYFASSAIRMLNSLGMIDFISFGTEEENIDTLNYISDSMIQNEELLYNYIKDELKKGISFPNARQNAIKRILTDINVQDIISKSNNILALEYITELKKLNSKIIPINVKRENDYNEKNIDNNFKYISATAIRDSIKNGNIESIKKFVPNEVYELLYHDCAFNDYLFDIIKYKIISTSSNELEKINEVTEGLENKIKKEIINSTSYKELIENIKSKRYNLTKIKRILINIMLNITKDDFNRLYNNHTFYAHVLAFSDKGKKLLPELSKNSSIPVITSINDKLIKSQTDDLQYLIKKDIYASNIHSIICSKPSNSDYYNKF